MLIILPYSLTHCDKSHILNLGKQMYPGRSKFMRKEHEDATTEPYGYLFIVLRPSTPSELKTPSMFISQKVTLNCLHER